MRQTISGALDDMLNGIVRYRVWMALAHEDIGDEHRQTALGPIWLLINYLIYIGTFLVVFGSGRRDMADYAIYTATGLLTWLYLSEVITRSTTLFKREESFISGTTLPLTIYIMRLTTQSVIRTGYAAVGCIGVLAIAHTPLSAAWLWALVGILLIIATTPAVVTVFAMIGAFFPDLQFIIKNLMRVGIFLTPIFWTHATGVRGALYRWNPFTYELEIVRQPILNGVFPSYAFAICVCASIIFWTLAVLLLGRWRKQVVFVI